MASGTITGDTSTSWFRVNGNDGIHITMELNSGTGTFAIEKYLVDSAVPVYDADGIEITYSASFEDVFSFRNGDIVRLTASSTSTPDADWSITGPCEPTTV